MTPYNQVKLPFTIKPRTDICQKSVFDENLSGRPKVNFCG